MTDEGSHWGAPLPGTSAPAPIPAPEWRLRAAYGLLTVTGALLMTGTGVLALGGPKQPAQRHGSQFTVQTVPSATPALSALPSGGPPQRIAPAKGPYTYLVPDGFAPVSAPRTSVNGQSGLYETAVAPRGAEIGDLIAVSVYELGTNSEPFSYAQLQAEIDRLARQVTATPGAAQRQDVGGKRALRYVFHFGTATVINYFIFTGTTELQVRCQWTEQQATIERGCGELVASLTLS